MHLRRRRLLASVGVLLVVSLGGVTGVQAATPPTITPDAATLNVDEGQTAEMGGTFEDTDGDSIALSASVGTIIVDPDDSGRWIWSMPVLDGPADSQVVTVTATDVDGPTDATFTLNAINVAPEASTTGPKFVPVFSASDRLFLWTATDVAADTVTPVTTCGTGIITAEGDFTTPGVKTLRCSFPDAAITQVGVQATDEDGGSTDGTRTTRATANVASMADADIQINGAAGGDQLGGAVATSDLNHDGKADIAIGSTITTNGSVVDPGYVKVVFGRSTFGSIDLGSLGGAGFTITGPAGVGFGRSLASAGDLNGDGIDDLLIGAEGASSGKGIVYVVFGSATIGNIDITNVADAAKFAKITGAATGSLEGRALAGLGDFNGDAHDDIAIGSPGLSGGDGGVDIVFGGTGFANVDLAALGTRGTHVSSSGDGSGSSLAGGDVNGDGKTEVIIGSGAGTDSNATIIYGNSLNAATIGANPPNVADGFRIGGTEDLGITAVAAGDMDHDGYADVAILHPNWADSGPWDASIVRSLGGGTLNTSITTLATEPGSRVIRISSPSDTLAQDMTMLDSNHDLHADLLIGAALDENNGEGSGSAFLIRGANTLSDVNFDVLDTNWVRIDGDNWNAFAGDAVGGGDVTGDGKDDVVIGAPGQTSWDDASLPGRVSVFIGAPLDLTKPTVTAPTRSIPVGLNLNGSSPMVRIKWTGSDTGSGISHYDLAQRTNTGAWVTVGVTASTHLDRALATGKDYRFRVRGVDNDGNQSDWVYGTTFHLSGYQDTSSTVKYKGTWKVGHATSYAGGTTHYAKVAGRKASLTFTGRQVVLAAPTGPGRGSARIYINGTYKTTISLFSATNQPTHVVGSWSWSTSKSRKITIRVSGTAGHPRFDVDKFITVK